MEAHPPWACGAFVAAVTVVTLVVFETLFFVFYIAPGVEVGNIKLSATRIASGIGAELEQGFSCSEIQGDIAAGVQHFPAPPETPSVREGNRAAIANVTVTIVVVIIALLAWWFLYLRGRIRFPAAAIARETAPLLLAFALYDFLYFQFFVRTWNTGSVDEFLYAMTDEILHPTIDPPSGS